MARDEDLSLAVLQGAGLSQVGLYPLSVLGRWPPLHTLDEAALRHSSPAWLGGGRNQTGKGQFLNILKAMLRSP